jgi:hypothetical protein
LLRKKIASERKNLGNLDSNLGKTALRRRPTIVPSVVCHHLGQTVAAISSLLPQYLDNSTKVLCALAEKDGHNTLAGLLRVTICCRKSCIGSKSRPYLADIENRSNLAAETTSRAPKAEKLALHVPSGEIITAPSQTAKCGGARRQPAVLSQEHLRARRRAGISHRTVNGDLVAVRSFCQWLIHRRRMHEDPTRGLERLNQDIDRRRERRALTDLEIGALFTLNQKSKRIAFRLTGRDLALLYLVALRTGLRRGELQSLTTRSFDFSVAPPTVRYRSQ